MEDIILDGKESTSKETRELRLAESLVASSCNVIRPYFLWHLPETTPPSIVLEEDLLMSALMRARKTEKGNHLIISPLAFQEILNLFPKNRDERAYNCAYFLHGVVHELIHFSQPLPTTPMDETQIEWVETHRGWVEGTAYLVSWLLLSDLYRDSKSELWFWIFHKSPDAMKKAIEKREMRVGLERVMAVYNYYFYLAFQRCGTDIRYEPPYFLPEPTKKLYNQMVATGSLPFPTFIGKKNTTRVRKGENPDSILYLAKAGRGVMASASLLQKNVVTVRDIIRNPLNYKEIQKILENLT